MSLIKNKQVIYKLDEAFAEFYGILLGDGCISKYLNDRWYVYEFRIDGNSITDCDYYENHVKHLIERVIQRTIKIRFRKDCNGIYVKFKSKSLALFLHKKLYFPIGKKGEICINNLIYQNPIFLRKALIGFFDTDGSLYFTKNNAAKIRNYPIIELSTHSNKLLIQLETLLSDLGFTCKISHYHDSVKLHGKKSLLRWFRFLGSNNPDKISKYKFWMKFGYCPKNSEMDIKTRLSKLGPIA